MRRPRGGVFVFGASGLRDPGSGRIAARRRLGGVFLLAISRRQPHPLLRTGTAPASAHRNREPCPQTGTAPASSYPTREPSASRILEPIESTPCQPGWRDGWVTSRDP